MKKKKRKKYKCDRCGKEEIKPFYRYPHVWKRLKNGDSCKKAVYSCLLIFCESCMKIFDDLNEGMRLKYMYKDNNKLIKFYDQYRRKK